MNVPAQTPHVIVPNDVSEELVKWLVRTVDYYIRVEKLTAKDSFEKLVTDIDYYYMLSSDDKKFKEFPFTWL